MSRLSKTMRRAVVLISVVCLGIAAVSVIAMMIQIVVDGGGRFLFKRPLVGSIEMVMFYYMVFASFLPLGYAQSQKQLMIMEVASSKLPVRLVHWIDAFALFLGLIIAAVLGWFGWLKAVEALSLGEWREQLWLPSWPARFVIPLGFLSLCVQLLLDIIEHIRKATIGERSETPEPIQKIE